METFVRVSPARRGFLPVLFLLILSFVTAASTQFQAQTPEPPPRLWSGGTTLLSGWPEGATPNMVSTVTANTTSSDGRFVVFTSDVPMFWPADMNGKPDVFLRDRHTNRTTRVSVPTAGAGSEAHGESGYASISADGRYVTFASEASNLTNDYDGNLFYDIFVRDTVEHTTSRVSTATDGTVSNGDSTLSAISADGRFVAFFSMADNLAPGITHPGQLFLRDRDVDADGTFDEPGEVSTTLISVANDGSPANAALSGTIDMTPDGRYVAFASAATNLVPNDTNGVIDVFVRDRQTGLTRRASVMSDGSEAIWNAASSLNPSLTPDGRLVVFESASALIANDWDNTTDIFLHDFQTAETTRVNEPGGGEYGPWHNVWPSISDDGRYVAYEAGEPNRGENSYQNVFVVDRQTGYFYPGNIGEFGLRMGPITTRPWISGDGTTIVFMHVNGDASNVYAAVDFTVTPTQMEFNSIGTEQTVTITTSPGTGWPVTSAESWIIPIDGENRAGSGTLRVKLTRNSGNDARFGTLKIGPLSVSIVQPEGMRLYEVYPGNGSTNGGETVMIVGSGFVPGATVKFGGVPATVTDVWWSQIYAVTPPHAAGPVDVEVLNGNGDTQTLTGGFTFVNTDTTPPVIEPIVTGILGNNGWYVSNVTLTWSITDPESQVTSVSGCDPVTQTVDTYELTPITCTATSAGGANSASYTIKRDTEVPLIAFQTPERTIYTRGQHYTVSYSCDDQFGSGIESCVGTLPNGSALDTSTPGYYDFSFDIADFAGKQNSGTITYAVSSGVCTATPADIVSWWSGDYSAHDRINFNHGIINGSFGGGFNAFGTGLNGSANSAFRLNQGSGTLTSVNFGRDPSLTMTNAFTVAAWIHGTNTPNNHGVIIKKSGEYGLALQDNYLVYYFGSASPTTTWHFIPRNVWTHVAMTYDSGVLTVYANGRVVHTANVAATLVDAVPAYNDLMLGASQDFPGHIPPFVGLIDEVQLYRRALTSADVESMFLSGAAGTCKPQGVMLTVSPVSTTYTLSGSTTMTTLSARLMSAGAGVEGRTVTFELFDAAVGTAVTDSNGYASLDVNLAGKNAAIYTAGIEAKHVGDATTQSSSASNTVTIARAIPVITWPTPEPVVYGATMGAAQMTAQANVGGTFTYSPSTSTLFSAGMRTLTVNFTPSDSTNFHTASASVVLEVKPATPTLTVNAGTYTYDRRAHSAMYSAVGIFNEPLSATVKYNGTTTAPTNAGSYTVVATVSSPNYEATPVTAATPLVIAQATPVVTVTAGTSSVYNGFTRQATASASGVDGEPLTPVTVTYNGNSALPIEAGTYTVVATYEGSQNYAAASATAATPLTITKAMPAFTLTPASFTYDGTPHAAVVSATGVSGEVLTPVDVTYNGAAAPPVDAGVYSVIASFAGSSNYTAATSVPVTLTIHKRSPQLTITNIGSATYDGAPHAATASATGLGGEVLTPVTITYNGNSTAPTNVGTYTVVASFAATTNYEAASVTSPTPLTIGKATPTMTITGENVTYDGNPHTLTATVTGVTGEALTPVTITYNGDTTAPVAAGTYTVVASFAGSANYEPASKTAGLGISKAQPSVSWTPAPAVYGTPLGAAQLNASTSVPGTWSYSRPAGTVLHAGYYSAEASFTPADGANYGTAHTAATIVITPAPLTIQAVDQVKAFGAPVPVLTINYIGLVNGDTPATVASVLSLSTSATAASAVGTYPIGPVWGSGVNDYTYAFVPGVLTVQPAATSTTVTSSANPSGVNQAITFTASVGVIAPGAGQPAGTLTFSNGSTVLGTAALQDGAASLTTGLATGTHAITVTYSGDASFSGSQGSLTQTVNASSGSTTTTVTSSLNPSKSGQSVTLTARVTSSSGTPTGQVEFFNSGVLIGTGTLSSGAATLTTSALAVGSHAITVRYLGSATRPPSLSPTLVQVVNTSAVKKKSTTLTASASPSTGTYGNESTFTVTVAPPFLQSTPTGNVRFEIDGVSATIVALSPSGRNGVATLRTSTLPRGTHRIVCTYLGDSAYAGSTSTITYVVN